jgi:hypothetical protein
MRTIKFRYRIKDLNDNRIITYFKTLQEVKDGLIILTHRSYSVISIDEWTGVKDIYENDIVWLKVNDEEKHRGLVQFKAPRFFVMDRKDSGLLLTDSYEVIGDIYNDPQLLK